jgi:16S rRNA (guanine527-N7)-methyltransferase
VKQYQNPVNWNDIPQEMQERFQKYVALIKERSRLLNLVSSGDVDVLRDRHILDSLAVVPMLQGSEEIIDIGAGAGFPGLPVRMWHPDTRLVFVESRRKRAEFLVDAVTVLNIKNCRVLNQRVEDVAHSPEYRGCFDVALARAVANLSVLWEYMLPLLKIGGVAIAYKSRDIGKEIKDSEVCLEMLGGQLADTVEYVAGNYKGLLVVARKIKSCPEEYPRSPGRAEKRPIGLRAKVHKDKP